MSLLNLKKSKPLAKPNLRTVEDFIDDALQVSPLPASTHRTDTLSDRMAAKSWSFASLGAHGAQQLSARTSYPKRTATRWMQRS